MMLMPPCTYLQKHKRLRGILPRDTVVVPSLLLQDLKSPPFVLVHAQKTARSAWSVWDLLQGVECASWNPASARKAVENAAKTVAAVLAIENKHSGGGEPGEADNNYGEHLVGFAKEAAVTDGNHDASENEVVSRYALLINILCEEKVVSQTTADAALCCTARDTIRTFRIRNWQKQHRFSIAQMRLLQMVLDQNAANVIHISNLEARMESLENKFQESEVAQTFTILGDLLSG